MDVRYRGGFSRQAARLTCTGLLFLTLLGLGCQPPPQKVQETETPNQPPPPPPPSRKIEQPVFKPPTRISPRKQVIGTSVEGRPLECLQLGNGDEVILFIASIHGNEPAGTPLVRRLMAYLGEHPELIQGRRILFIPEANPDGLLKSSRLNARRVDLNRNFPSANYSAKSNHGSASLSEPESQALYKLLKEQKPARIISMHQPANHGVPCIDYDGPAEALARAMAARCDLPVKRLGGQSGSLGSYAGSTMRIPIITVELPKSASTMSSDTLWNKYGKMMLVAINAGR